MPIIITESGNRDTQEFVMNCVAATKSMVEEGREIANAITQDVRRLQTRNEDLQAENEALAEDRDRALYWLCKLFVASFRDGAVSKAGIEAFLDARGLNPLVVEDLETIAILTTRVESFDTKF